MMNTWCGIGRITADPEVKFTSDGTAITSFYLAVSRNFKNKAGTYDTDFIPCVAYKKRAELIADRLSKGALIGVKGPIRIDKVEKDGTVKYYTKVIVEDVFFLDKKSNQTEDEFLDDDIPF